jgi:hypothetical protein
VNVVDSSGWLEYFGDGPNAAFFAGPLAKAEDLIVPAISIFEVFKRVLQQRDETSALQAAALMQQGRTVALDPALAMAAAKLSFELKLPMADGHGAPVQRRAVDAGCRFREHARRALRCCGAGRLIQGVTSRINRRRSRRARCAPAPDRRRPAAPRRCGSGV